MGSTLDGAEIGRRMLEILDRILEITASVVHVYEDSGALRILYSHGLEDHPRVDASSEEAESARRRTLETERRHTLQVDEGLVGIFIPLCSRSRAVGLLEAYGPSFGRTSVEFLSSLCTQAAIALDNSRLYGRVLEHEQTLQRLVDRMVRVQEDERRRVAHEIHDGLTQTLVAINHHLEAFSRDFAPHDPQGRERLDRVAHLTHSAINESQRITFGLRPTVLEDLGLSAAIRLEAESLEAQGFRVSYTEDLANARLPEAVEITLYRVAQEALSNVRKHAGVHSAEVSLELRGEEARMRVADLGVGFDPGELSQAGGLGLLGMRERVELIGGRLDLESRVGHGTEISVSAPLPASEGGASG